MKRVKIYFVCILVLLIVVSCSIDKKIYSKGYHIEWNKNSISKKSIVSNSNFIETLSTNTENDETKTIVLNNNTITTSKAIQTNLDSVEATSSVEIYVNSEGSLINSTSNECDSIILRNGNVTLGKVIEISDNTIKFTKCNSTKDVVRELNQNEVSYVKYSDGTKEEFTKESGVSGEVLFGTLLAGLSILISSLSTEAGLVGSLFAVLFSLIGFFKTKSSIVSYLSLLAALASIVIIVLLFL